MIYNKIWLQGWYFHVIDGASHGTDGLVPSKTLSFMPTQLLKESQHEQFSILQFSKTSRH